VGHCESLVGLRVARETPIPGTELVIQKGKKVRGDHILALRKASVAGVEIDETEIEGAFAAADIVDPETGEVLLEANEELSPRVMTMAQEKGVEFIDVFFPSATRLARCCRSRSRRTRFAPTRRR